LESILDDIDDLDNKENSSVNSRNEDSNIEEMKEFLLKEKSEVKEL
jgi:hypothetical protein